MRNRLAKASLFGVATLSTAAMASASTIIYSDDFEDGDASDWNFGSYSNTGGGAGPNADSPTPTMSVAAPFNGTANGLTLDTVMFDLDSNPSWAGTQVNSPLIAGSGFTGSAPADVEMGFTFAVTADPGVISYVQFELREQGGITTHALQVPVSDITGGINTFSFNLADNQSGAFTTRGTGFDTSFNHQVYAQIHESWGLNGSTREISLTMDDFFITTAVPEPTGSLLSLVGACLLGVRRRR